jgi:hypothetical protein
MLTLFPGCHLAPFEVNFTTKIITELDQSDHNVTTYLDGDSTLFVRLRRRRGRALQPRAACQPPVCRD